MKANGSTSTATSTGTKTTWAKLGSKADVPVVGDWDGDGKDDIGIFGPEWPGDPRHIEFLSLVSLILENREIKPRPKNVPEVEQATDGDRLPGPYVARERAGRTLSTTSSALAKGINTPIVGDRNGDGISTIGVFKDKMDPRQQWRWPVDQPRPPI
ncbi:MAG: hypothetical protein U0894_09395 [Pirellulales bacterium]